MAGDQPIQWLTTIFAVDVASYTRLAENGRIGATAIANSPDEADKLYQDIQDVLLREAIVRHCCEAWNNLVDQPWQIISIGTREWARRS